MDFKQDYAYYYQVQTQMHVCKRKYCDFVVWSENEGVLVDWVLVDAMFYNNTHNDQERFFKYGILLKITGKWLMRQPISDKENVQTPMPSIAETDEEDYKKVWCYCSQPSRGEIIFCENDSCTIKWFHCDCMRIRKISKGSWRYPSCHEFPKIQKNMHSLVQ